MLHKNKKFFHSHLLMTQKKKKLKKKKTILIPLGSWGVSHTRVPTESRPGHVAMIAGMYEDVSAVTRGWKNNPVGFDSVFNRSRHVWGWGSPDILPMFAIDSPQVEIQTYSAEYEDFGSDMDKLDSWVFDRVKIFFENAKKGENKTLVDLLSGDKIIFFLHLLGIDSQGHVFRPHSREYSNTIRLVDEGIKQISSIFEDYFNDTKTSFVFTADHGMSSKGFFKFFFIFFFLVLGKMYKFLLF